MYRSFRTIDGDRSISNDFAMCGALPIVVLVPEEFGGSYNDIIENHYMGQGCFGSEQIDFQDLLKQWNQQMSHVDDIGSTDQQMAALKYPLKVVSMAHYADNPCQYEDFAGYSRQCEFGGFYYPGQKAGQRIEHLQNEVSIGDLINRIAEWTGSYDSELLFSLINSGTWSDMYKERMTLYRGVTRAVHQIQTTIDYCSWTPFKSIATTFMGKPNVVEWFKLRGQLDLKKVLYKKEAEGIKLFQIIDDLTYYLGQDESSWIRQEIDQSEEDLFMSLVAYRNEWEVLSAWHPDQVSIEHEEYID